MSALTKHQRITKLLELLQQTPPRHAKNLAENLNTTVSTIYRDIQELEKEYAIDKDDQNRYFLCRLDNGETFLSLTIEEIDFLHTLLEANTDEVFGSSIANKLYKKDNVPVQKSWRNRSQQATMIVNLREAIKSKEQVKLIGYSSAKSNTVTDRVIEPLDFYVNYQCVIAYEPESGVQKHYRIDRMKAVEKLYKPRTYRGRVEDYPDGFNMTGKPFAVKVRLSERAYQLLRWEFPTTETDVSKEAADPEKPYLLETTVKSHKGIGRFLLGLITEVQVLEPASLISYLKEKAQEGGLMD